MNTPHAWLVSGQVMHQRLRPARHRFVYPVFYLRVDLAHLAELNSAWFGVDRWRPLSLRTRDYGARDGSSLEAWMRETLERAGIEADGPVILHTFPRLFGFAFNPVSFWYCHGADGSLRAVLAEVNNTFGETHRYLLDAGQGITDQTVLCSPKQMHVSPFCAVAGQYRFRFRNTPDTDLVRIQYCDEQGALINTAVGGRVSAWTAATVLRHLLKMPWMTLMVVLGIHWEAFRLWRKGVPWFSKPATPATSLTATHTPQTNQGTLSS